MQLTIDFMKNHSLLQYKCRTIPALKREEFATWPVKNYLNCGITAELTAFVAVTMPEEESTTLN